jgi:hypothetical protein
MKSRAGRSNQMGFKIVHLAIFSLIGLKNDENTEGSLLLKN